MGINLCSDPEAAAWNFLHCLISHSHLDFEVSKSPSNIDDLELDLDASIPRLVTKDNPDARAASKMGQENSTLRQAVKKLDEEEKRLREIESARGTGNDTPLVGGSTAHRASTPKKRPAVEPAPAPKPKPASKAEEDARLMPPPKSRPIPKAKLAAKPMPPTKSKPAPRSKPEQKQSKPAKTVYSHVERLPNEILNTIAANVTNDRDFVSLSSSCEALRQALEPKESAIWKMRFLSLYDPAFVSEEGDYIVAYKLRRFVVSRFVDFDAGELEKSKIQLEVLRDMVIETYTPAKPHLPPPTTSRNLVVLESPQTSPWMLKFLSAAFFPHTGGYKYGTANYLFDALQVTLSHLLLSPRSKMAYVLRPTRADYDLIRVYNWSRPFSTLYRRVAIPKGKAKKKPRQRKGGKKAAENKIRAATPEPPEFQYELDMHSLLHIRNFFHRHLINVNSGPSGEFLHWNDENTYGNMALKLAQAGLAPNKWDRPLSLTHSITPATTWYGHYSTLIPWPKTNQELQECQSAAEDWSTVDPLKLDFSISRSNGTDGIWPPIFSSIPAFHNTVPNVDDNRGMVIQGLATFVDIKLLNPKKPSTQPKPASTTTEPKLPRYHPYLSLRVRGVIHPISSRPSKSNHAEDDINAFKTDQEEIPGWQRIVMVMYKPCKRYLIQVLEYDEENYGDHFGTVISAPMTAAAATAPGTVVVDPEETEKRLCEHLKKLLLSRRDWYEGKLLERTTIEAMEANFRDAYALDWNDMDFAYAYEGVLIPGGKIMLGRWWRCGLYGGGEGKELDPDGEPLKCDVEDATADNADDGDADAGGDPMDLDQKEEEKTPAAAPATVGGAAGAKAKRKARRAKAVFQPMERGPFVFWSA